MQFEQSKALLFFVRSLKTSSRDERVFKRSYTNKFAYATIERFGGCKRAAFLSWTCCFGVDLYPALSKYMFKQNYVGLIVELTGMLQNPSLLA